MSRTRGRNVARRTEKPNDSEESQVTIQKVPNELLLEVFSFCVDEAQAVNEAESTEGAQAVDKARAIDQWHTLVHVCKRWRLIVLASPRRLKLRLLCTEKRPVREKLCIWPATLPIVIQN